MKALYDARWVYVMAPYLYQDSLVLPDGRRWRPPTVDTVVIQAIEDFSRKEEMRWEQIRARTLLPLELEPDEKLDELIQSGYELMSMDQTAAGCDRWLLAWEQVKEMAAPNMGTVETFDEAYPEPLQ